MANTELKILLVHGIGGHAPGAAWEESWRASVVNTLQAAAPGVQPVIEFAHLDAEFAAYRISAFDVVQALGKLGASGVGGLFRRQRGFLGDTVDRVRWTAGMVVQWVENGKLRAATRAVLKRRIEAFAPQVVVAHSLGTLVAYDTFTHPETRALLTGRDLVTCGSQIGNPFVVGQFAAGRLTGLDQARHWYHLYNREDDVFTAPIRLGDANFSQVDTFFDIEGMADHDVEQYMQHRAAADAVWATLGAQAQAAAAPRTRSRAAKSAAGTVAAKPAAKATKPAARKPRQRALIVGVNEYADPSANLAGCVNDAYLTSALLQESGFDAGDIRLLLNDRATVANLKDRLEWLLDDVRGGDTCVFYFSGHGAQVPSYGPDERVDRVNESLVLHDFDWSSEKLFSDTEFRALYSQLPYELRLICLFDCCHSGGMTRAASRRVRGLNPPDDVRHRMLRWDGAREMWLPREFESPNAAFDRRFNGEATGSGGLRATHRLGQAMELRRGLQTPADGSTAAAKKLAAARDHFGPYLPTLIHACSESQFAYEYEHGPISHGAFTYCLAKRLRKDRRDRRRDLTFAQLVAAVRDELAELGYDQTPSLVAPSAVQKAKVPLKL